MPADPFRETPNPKKLEKRQLEDSLSRILRDGDGQIATLWLLKTLGAGQTPQNEQSQALHAMATRLIHLCMKLQPSITLNLLRQLYE